MTRQSATKNPPARKISKVMTFRKGTDGPVFHVDMQTKAAARGKVVTAAVDGRVTSVNITR